jgi:hypothetical protein
MAFLEINVIYSESLVLGPQPASSGQDPDPAQRDLILETVVRLARARPDGGHVIERAAILAAGHDATAIEAWIVGHGGRPEHAGAEPVGLHSPRVDARHQPGRSVLRFLLPPGALKHP